MYVDLQHKHVELFKELENTLVLKMEAAYLSKLSETQPILTKCQHPKNGRTSTLKYHEDLKSVTFHLGVKIL